MANQKVTPGEWTTDQYCKESDINIVAVKPDGTKDFGNGRIAQIQLGWHKDKAVSEANARLIAAAPQMYDALTHIRTLNANFTSSALANDNFRSSTINLIREVLTAIEKKE